VLGTVAPPKDVGQEPPVLAVEGGKPAGPKGGFGFNASLPPAWRGTLLPASDADVWLATAFADYERAVAGEGAALKKGEKPEAARDQLDKAVGFFRKTYSSVSAKLDVPLAEIKSSTASDDWYRLASSKGVLLLHALRAEVGGPLFDKTMDEFGMEFGGRRVASQQFQAHFEKATGRKLDAFFQAWLREKGLPAAQQEPPKDKGADGTVAPADRERPAPREPAALAAGRAG